MGCTVSSSSKSSKLDSFGSKYELGAELGRGAYATVYSANNKVTFKKVAVKVVKKCRSEDEFLRQEVDILKRLKHPNIVSCLDFFEDYSSFYVVMELVEGGEVFDQIIKKDTYSELEARELVFVLLNAIQYCHQRNIVHRDLKLENLLLASKSDTHFGSIKVADFGFATKVKGTKKMLVCGTPEYIAPEVLSKVPYGAPCDMWSIGIITYILLGGYPPFQEKNQKDLFEKIKSGKFSFHNSHWKNISDEAKDFVKKLLVVDQTKRFTADQALRHGWIQKAASEMSMENLDSNLKALKRYNVRRKILAVARTVIAANRFKNMFKSKQGPSIDCLSPCCGQDTTQNDSIFPSNSI